MKKHTKQVRRREVRKGTRKDTGLEISRVSSERQIEAYPFDIQHFKLKRINSSIEDEE